VGLKFKGEKVFLSGTSYRTGDENGKAF